MLFYPPVEKMVEMVGSNYELANLMSKRAKQIFLERMDSMEEFDKKEIQVAAEEIYSGKISSQKSDTKINKKVLTRILSIPFSFYKKN